jgi:hypothetical protein
MDTAQGHIDNEEYIEAVECIKEESGPTIEKWPDTALNMMALSEANLHNYRSAYTYYILANNKKEASKLFEKIPTTELEEKYAEYISDDVKIIKVKGRRGVFVTNDLPNYHQVCRIPLHLCTEGTKKELTEYISENNVHSRSMPKHHVMPVMWDPPTCDQIGVSPLRLVLEQNHW